MWLKYVATYFVKYLILHSNNSRRATQEVTKIVKSSSNKNVKKTKYKITERTNKHIPVLEYKIKFNEVNVYKFHHCS